MSWQTDIENKIFNIKCGDGQSYTPKWRNANKLQEYNTSVFEFINVAGSLVDRRKAKGRRFDLEFYFDGENAINSGNAFATSASDPRRWTISHPFYGEIKCQPLSISQDNSQYNVSKFTCTVIETLLEGWPKAEIAVSDQIVSVQAIANERLAQAYVNSNQINRATLKTDVQNIDKIYSKGIKSTTDLQDFKDKVSDAIIAIDDAEFSALEMIRTVQSVINYPATILQTVEDRINILKEAMISLADSITGILSSKHQYEIMAGTVISSMQVASSDNSNYETKRQVIDQQDLLIDQYNSYLDTLDSLQTERADSDDSYSANFDAMNSLNSLVNLSISNLYNIAFAAKQEREFICDKDYNPILLTHRFYGLNIDDSNLDKFIKTNNIGLNEMLNIRKGRKVVYYV